MPVLVIDIGNTSTSIAVANGKTIGKVTRTKGADIVSLSLLASIKKLIKGKNISGAIFCSVVPSVNRSWIAALRDLLGKPPLVVKHDMNLNVAIDYPEPETIGADRIANACGAVDLYGAPVIVADFGTALTFDVVSADKAYVGGIITPGLPLMTDYLHEKTALLPKVDVKGHGDVVIGKSTESAIHVGARIGYRGMVHEIVDEVTKELGGKNVTLCATGGFSEWVLKGLNLPFHFDPKLTLYGLSRIHMMNR